MRCACLCVVLLAVLPVCRGQRAGDAHGSPKATVIRQETIYLQGDATSAKLGVVEPGREISILNRSGKWLNVYANTDIEKVRTADTPVFGNPNDANQGQPISGWIENTDVVESSTPNGQSILFGDAISNEQLAASAHPAPGAAVEARRLYRMAAQLYPQGPRTAEALWRAADIRWQLEKQDAAELPSSHEKENYLREQPGEDEMQDLEKFFPGTEWASFAAYELIDNKLCGDWQGSEQCPEKEAGYYQDFAEKYPKSPRAAHALYEAAWRLACAGDMWAEDKNEARSTDDRNRAVETAQHLLQKYPDGDYAARASDLVFKVERGVPVYGSDRQ